MGKEVTIRILVVEDEPITRKRLSAFLAYHGYEVKAVETASAAVDELQRFEPHVVLLDILLPDSTDFSLAEQIASKTECGLIITSSFDRREDRISGLRAGADDYLTKPCDMDELRLKVERLAARVQQSATGVSLISEHFRFGEWLFEPESSELRHNDGNIIRVTSKEKMLLELFLKHPHRLFSRSQLIESVSSSNDEIFDRAIDSSISRLRKKIELNPKVPQILKSVYGEGYILDIDVHRVKESTP